MKLDKKQAPRLIALGVILVACIGFVAFQLNGGNAIPPAPVKRAGAVNGADASSAANPVTGQGDAAATQTGAQLVRRDPFQPVPLPIDPATIPPPEPNQQSAAKQPSHRQQFRTTNVPPLGVVLPTGSNSTLGIKPVVEEDKDPSFVLTGIVRGAQNVAIIRVGESGRYVVKPGQLVEGRYLVLSVTDDSATLTYKGRRIEIRLGGVKNAS